MNKMLKGLGFAAVAVAAVGICYIGYQKNNDRQYEQRVSYAETAVTNEKSKLEELQKKVNDFYANKDKDFLKKDIKTADVTKVKSDLEAVRVTADDFNIKEGSLPEGIKELEKQKTEISKNLTDVSDKLRMQEQTNKLFTKEVPDWMEFKDEMAIQDKMKKDQVDEVSGKLSLFPDDKWRKVVKEYLKSASDQVKTADDLQKRFDELLKEGAIVTYEDYMEVLAKIEDIRNEKLKEKFTALAEEVSHIVGLVQESTYEEVIETETYEEVSTTETYEEPIVEETYSEPVYEEPIPESSEEQWIPETPTDTGNQGEYVPPVDNGGNTSESIVENPETTPNSETPATEESTTTVDSNQEQPVNDSPTE
jgi:hypothetical protein